MSKLYVAYGSNLNIRQMSKRCPDATVWATGWLRNWKLVYRRSGSGAYASIIRSKGHSVPIVLWSISPKDEKKLDRYEGYPRFYGKQNVFVETTRGKKKGMVYIMNRYAVPGVPSQHYINTVEEGYADNGLDLAYLDESLYDNRRECRFRLE